MNKNLEKELYNNFPPEWFEKMSPNYGHHWGFEVEDGWYNIIYELFECLAPYVKHLKEPNFQILQVKQKFGGLRIYTTHETDIIVRGLVNWSEQRANSICEICGEIGKPNGKSVRCEKHNK